MIPTTVRAVYENGVLRPDRPLPLRDGEAVEITLGPAPPLTDEDAVALIRGAKTVQQLWAALEAVRRAGLDDGYDVVRGADEYRRQTGQPPLLPRPGDEDFR